MEKIQKDIIGISVITSFVTTFMGSALNLSIPMLEKEFSVSAQAIGWVVTIYMLVCSALAIPFGKIADVIDRKKVLKLGTLIFTVSSLASIISKELWVLLVFRAFQGLGGSMIFSTNLAILASAFTEEERGKVLGYATCANYAGLSAGPVVGGILNHNFGWRAIFIVTGAISLIGFLLEIFRLKSGERSDSESITDFHLGKNNKNGNIKSKAEKPNLDILGSVLFVFSIAIFMYGLSSIKTSKFATLFAILGLGLFVLFIKRENRISEPVLKVSLFRENIVYAFSNLVAFINYGAVYTISYLISIYLQVAKGFSSQNAGFVLITQALVMALLSLIMGKLSDKHSPRIMSMIGISICTVSLFMCAFISTSTKLWYIITMLSVSGIGLSLFGAPNTNLIMSCTKKEDYGMATSILSSVRSLGHTMAMALLTAIIGIYMGSKSLNDAPPDILLKTIHTSFFIFAGLSIIGIFMAGKKKV